VLQSFSPMENARSHSSYLLVPIVSLISLLASACTQLALTPTSTPIARPPTASPAPSATSLPTATPVPTPTPAPTATPLPHDLYLAPDGLILHPDGALYSGDRVSFEIFASNAQNIQQPISVAVYLDNTEAPPIVEGAFGQFGIAAREQATFTWAWDTSGLEGMQTLYIWLDPNDEIQQGDENPDNNLLAVPVALAPRSVLPPPEAGAVWTSTESACCVYHYITHTAADRDIQHIVTTSESAVHTAQEALGDTLDQKMVFTFIPRLLGHGGFASNEIVVSYLDRDYAGGGLANVIAHEATHVLDGQSGGAFRPTLLVEGLAVYLAGGHFKLEPLDRRAAQLRSLDLYIPLAQLADDFYPSQHEIGYLEGGAFLLYLVETYGWKAFDAFYRSIPEPANGQTQSVVLDQGLLSSFGKSLAEIESEWLASLESLAPDPRWAADVADTVVFYDTVRRYEQLLDPSAYFLTAWLPDQATARERGIIADFLRHPQTPENIALETMLVAAARGFESGEYDRIESLIAEVNLVLDGIQSGFPDPFAQSPVAQEYLALTRVALELGYEPQGITLQRNSASVTAIAHWPSLEDLTFTSSGATWALAR